MTSHMDSAHSSVRASEVALYIFIRMDLSYVTHMYIASMQSSNMFLCKKCRPTRVKTFTNLVLDIDLQVQGKDNHLFLYDL